MPRGFTKLARCSLESRYLSRCIKSQAYCSGYAPLCGTPGRRCIFVKLALDDVGGR